MSQNAAGRLLVDKLGDGERSPDLADAATMVMAPRMRWVFSDELFTKL